MPHISGGKRGTPRERDTSYLRVAHVHRTPSFLPLSRQWCCFGRRSAVEIQHTVFQVLVQQAGKRRFQRLPSPACRQQRETEASFEQRDAGDPDGFGGLAVQPRHHGSLGCRAHQRRKHVGIEDDHLPNFIDRGR